MYSFQRAKILLFLDNKNVCVHKIDIHQKNNIFYECTQKNLGNPKC